MNPTALAKALLTAALASATLPAQATWFVNASAAPGGTGLNWAQAFTSLESAFAARAPGDEIWVAAGRYVPSAPQGFVLPANVTLRGGFAGTETRADDADPIANRTVLDGDVRGDDLPAFGNRQDNRITVAGGSVAAGETLIIDGFFVRGGQTPSPLRDTGPAGMRLFMLGGTAELRRCVFTENGGGDAGGALGITSVPFGGSGSVRVIDCLFAHNRSLGAFGGEGGAIVCSGGVEILGCTFRSNQAPVAGAIDAGPDTAIAHCTFEDNRSTGDASAIRMRGGTGPLLVLNSRFLGNRAGGDGTVLVEDTAAMVAGCEFSGNRATNGGSVIARGNSGISPFMLTLASCTVVGNDAAVSAGGIATQGTGTLTIDNSILYSNRDAGGSVEPAQIAASTNTSTTVRTCCIEGLVTFSGNGNFATDPLLNYRGFDQIAGTADDDLRVGLGSPCLEVGDFARLPADVLDLDGDGNQAEPLPTTINGTPRVLNLPGLGPPGAPILDVGAHEGPTVPMPGSFPSLPGRFAIAIGIDDEPLPAPQGLAPANFPTQRLVPATAGDILVRIVADAVAPGTPLILAGQFYPTHFEPQLLPQLRALHLSLLQTAFYLPTTATAAGPLLPFDGFAIPPGLSQQTLRLQAFALGVGATIGISDASEFYFD